MHDDPDPRRNGRKLFWLAVFLVFLLVAIAGVLPLIDAAITGR